MHSPFITKVRGEVHRDAGRAGRHADPHSRPRVSSPHHRYRSLPLALPEAAAATQQLATAAQLFAAAAVL